MIIQTGCWDLVKGDHISLKEVTALNITMVKEKKIWDFDKQLLKIADTGSPLNTVLLDTGFNCYKDTISI